MLPHAPFFTYQSRLRSVKLLYSYRVHAHPSTIPVAQCNKYTRVRNASTAASAPYAFPTHPNPTPHQIFHLPHGANQHDIKARYYDLVRVHHPDSAAARGLEPTEATRRFAAIGAAYDTLRGKSSFSFPSSSSNPWSRPGDDEMREELRRRARAGRAYRRPQTDFDDDFWHGRRQWGWHGYGFGPGHGWGGHGRWHGAAEAGHNQSWKDWVIIIGGGVTFIAGTVPFVFSFSASTSSKHHRLAAQNLAGARAEAKEVGAARRREIRKRVRAHELECAEEALERASVKGRETLEEELAALGLKERARARMRLEKEREGQEQKARKEGLKRRAMWDEDVDEDDEDEDEWLERERMRRRVMRERDDPDYDHYRHTHGRRIPPDRRRGGRQDREVDRDELNGERELAHRSDRHGDGARRHVRKFDEDD